MNSNTNLRRSYESWTDIQKDTFWRMMSIVLSWGGWMGLVRSPGAAEINKISNMFLTPSNNVKVEEYVTNED